MTVQLDPTTHTYYDPDDPDKDYVSVTSVIRLLGIRKSFHGVNPAVLRFAAERGMAVESILYDLIRGQASSVTIPTLEQNGRTLRESVMDFLPGVRRWLEDKKPQYVAHQVIVSDPQAGIAGTLDLVIPGFVVDAKCTSQEEMDWKLQVGAYCEMYPEDAEPAVLHINPKFKKGYIWRKYDSDQCQKAWRLVRFAWMQSKKDFDDAAREIQTLFK